MTDKREFAEWAIVEVMGHQTFAGLVTEQSIAGHGYIRVDVPKTKHVSAFSKYFSPGSIYAITPVDEQIAKARAEDLGARPVSPYGMRELVDDLKGEFQTRFDERMAELKERERRLLAREQAAGDKTDGEAEF